MEPLLKPPVGFAHRGARAHAQENTLDAFRLALRLGATGLESDVWLTADRVPVLDHDGVVRAGLRRRAFGAVDRSELPAHIPTLEDLYAACGTGFELSLDICDAGAVDEVLAVARAASPDAAAKLWLCHPDWRLLASVRARAPEAKLVNSTRLRKLGEGPERRAASLARAGIDAVNMHATDWNAGLITLFHRFERLALGWDAQFDRTLRALLAMGCDAVYSDYVDRMVDALVADERRRATGQAVEPGSAGERDRS